MLQESETNALPCEGKLAFDTSKQAQAEATSSAWRHGTKLKIYKCKRCSLWHLASQYTGKDTD